MKRLAITLTALSSLVLFAPSSEARPYSHGPGLHHGHHHLGHGAWRGRRHGLHHHRLHRHHIHRFRPHHRRYRGYRGVTFRPSAYGYRPHAYGYGGPRGYRGPGFATGLGLAAAAAGPNLYRPVYSRPYGYRYAPAGYGCGF